MVKFDHSGHLLLSALRYELLLEYICTRCVITFWRATNFIQSQFSLSLYPIQ